MNKTKSHIEQCPLCVNVPEEITSDNIKVCIEHQIQLLKTLENE